MMVKKCWSMGTTKITKQFWKTLKMLLINSEINLILPWSEDCILISGGIENQAPKFVINDTKTWCSSCNFIYPRKSKRIRLMKIRF